MVRKIDRNIYLSVLSSSNGFIVCRSTKKKQQMLPFWEKKHEWFPTWNAHQQGDDISNALQVDYIRVYEYDPNDTADWYWYQTDLPSNSIVDWIKTYVLTHIDAV